MPTVVWKTVISSTLAEKVQDTIVLIMEKTVKFIDQERSGVIEFQAFKDNNDKFLVKELAILDLSSNVLYHFLFKPPCSFNSLNSKARRTNRWVTNYFSRINWLDGFISYSKFDSIMYRFCSKFKTIYTNGEEKRAWIQMFTTSKVVNYPISKEFLASKDVCCLAVANEKHANSNCAIKNAYRLSEYLSCNKEQYNIQGEEKFTDNTDEDDDGAAAAAPSASEDDVDDDDDDDDNDDVVDGNCLFVNQFCGGGRNEGYKYGCNSSVLHQSNPGPPTTSTCISDNGYSRISTIPCGSV